MNFTTLDFPEPLVQGTTLNSFNFVFNVGGTPLSLAGASGTLTSKMGQLIHNWAPSIDNATGTVTFQAVPASVTKSWPVGNLSFSSSLTLSTGPTIPAIQGALTVVANPCLDA